MSTLCTVTVYRIRQTNMCIKFYFLTSLSLFFSLRFQFFSFISTFSTVESHKPFFVLNQSFSLTSFKFNQTWVENWTKSYEIEFKRNSSNYCSLSLLVKLSIIDRYFLSFISESQTTSYDHQLMVRTGNQILSNNISLASLL